MYGNRMRQSHRRLVWFFILPSLVLLLLLAYPIANVFYYSLQHYNENKPYANGFAGLQNFVQIFSKDKYFFPSLLVSFKWVSIQVVLQLLFGLMIALVLNQKFRFRGVFRSVIFAPWAISGVLTSMMWSLIYNENIGLLNGLLQHLGIINKNIGWLATTTGGFWALTVAELWRGLPFFTILMLAALQQIPMELYEAARVDGAGRWKSFVRITLPYLKDNIVLATLLRCAWEFNNVDVIYTLTGGGPARATTTLTMYITQTAIKLNNFGYGSALSVVAFIILAVFATAYLKLSNFGRESQ